MIEREREREKERERERERDSDLLEMLHTQVHERQIDR